MSIQNASIMDNATALAPTGGTAITLANSGPALNGVVNAYVTNDSSMKTRRTLTFQVKKPKVNANSLGGYTQAYRKIEILFPRTLADGKVTYDAVKIEHRTDISATNAEINNQRYIGGQILGDSDFDAFYQALNES